MMRKYTPCTFLKNALITGSASTMCQARMFTSFAPKTNVQCVLLTPHSITTSLSVSSFSCTAPPLTSNIALMQQRNSLSTRSGKNSRRNKKVKLRRTNGSSNTGSGNTSNDISNKSKTSKAYSTHSAKMSCDSSTESDKRGKDQHAKKKLSKEKVELHCLQREAEDEATNKKEFYKMWHECFQITYEEFLLGAHQAYYTIGGALKLIDCELPNTNAAERPFHSHDNAIQVFADVIKDKFDIESSELLDNTETTNDEEKMEEERQCLKEIASNCNIWHFDMSATSASWRDKVSFQKFMQQVVPVFNSFLPCSIAFTHSIFQLWWAQHLRMYNLRSIAGPNDYIMASEIVLFASLDSSKKMKEQKNGQHYIDPRGKRQELKEDKTEHESEQSEVAEEEKGVSTDTTNHTATIRIEHHDDNKGETTCINVALPVMWWNKRPFADRKYVLPEWNGTLKELMRHVEQMRIKEHNTETTEVEIELPEVSNNSTSSAASMSNSTNNNIDNTDNVEKQKDSSEDTHEQHNITKDDIIKDNNKIDANEENNSYNSIEFCEEHNKYRVKVNSFTEFYAPQDALALVVVVLDVVIPPARKFDEYDKMYTFTSALKSLYKRAVVARYMAAMGLSKVLTMQDYFVRLMTGESFKDTYVKASLPLMDIPVDAETQVPTVRKYLCLYMDAAKQWNVSSIL